MKLFLKTASFFIAVLFAVIYINGCSSAEQTTAKLAFQQGDFAKAEVEFDKETKQNPLNEEAWYYLGASRIQLKKYDAADVAFTQYRKIGKNTFGSEIVTAWTSRFNSAADAFENGQKAKDNEAKLKLFQSAIDEFKVCKVILPDSTVVDGLIKSIDSKIAVITVNPIIDKGVEMDKAGNYEGAIGEYNKALDKVEKGSPTYEIVIFDISVAYLKWGEKLRTANSDDPAYKEKFAAAMPMLEALRDSKDKDTKIKAYDLLVQVYANLGMIDKATEAMKIRDELKGTK